jgi:hypothetical protein
LPARGTGTTQQAAIERQRKLARGKVRQFRRLVVTPFAQAHRVQRYRNDAVGQRRVILQTLTREQGAQQPRVGALAVIFQGTHQRVDREIEAPGAADQIESARLERIARSYAWQLRKTRCTQVERPSESGLLAQHAARRGQK